jgi:hypothetical protein
MLALAVCWQARHVIWSGEWHLKINILAMPAPGAQFTY